MYTALLVTDSIVLLQPVAKVLDVETLYCILA